MNFFSREVLVAVSASVIIAIGATGWLNQSTIQSVRDERDAARAQVAAAQREGTLRPTDNRSQSAPRMAYADE